ncbi:hypothetical protein [Methylophaga sp. OBS4]|uniref:hypothetical protein n=1 Tax=Methylophaga sp. OBS4 TaxID=2991935 RepID=UPI0022518C7D|nr:hypothetical protein [Methylophaga sp. OBS4]MCX4187158.1 hypothetical protein [Methylophaga sp. OBS4]
MIQLQFSAQKKPGSWLIRRFTWSPFSHVDFVLPNGRLLGARGLGGVQVRNAQHFDAVGRFQVAAPESVLDFAKSQVGKPYDWGAILGLVARHDWQDKNAWFCSELIAWCFLQAGVPLLRSQQLQRITPRDLLLSPYLVPAGQSDRVFHYLNRGQA